MFGDVARCGLGAPATDTDAVITHRQAAMATAATERKVLRAANIGITVGENGRLRRPSPVGGVTRSRSSCDFYSMLGPRFLIYYLPGGLGGAASPPQLRAAGEKILDQGHYFR